MTYSGTYSPDDNKLRLYPSGRLPEGVYARVKAAGFKWAPQQGLFVAPMWTPDRADLLEDLCGEIGDEDTGLVDRAEERAERFEEYAEKRAEDYDRAHEAVRSITAGIPLGQPILVGHHSERRARKDAERIEDGMRRAVRMWETSKYWQSRAAGAIRHAKYKERPDVRARRIKTIEADRRKVERSRAESARWLAAWTTCAAMPEGDEQARIAREIANRCWLHLPRKEGDREGRDVRPTAYDAITNAYPNLYAPRTLAEIFDTAAKVYPGSIAHCDRWLAHYDLRLAYERAMLAESGGTVADRTGPEKGGGCQCWAGPRGGWLYIQKVNRVTVTVRDNWGNGGRDFTRTIPFDKLGGVMSAADVARAREEGRLIELEGGRGFRLIDAPPPPPRPPVEPDAERADVDAMRGALKTGVQTVSAPQLFPTPPELARQVVELAQIEPGMTVLEPSAGTGALVRAVRDAVDTEVRAYEVNAALCGQLRQRFESFELHVDQADFLAVTENQGRYPRVVMNPPFERGSDIAHILHARKFLEPGGRLVAICANGPRQREALEPIAAEWIDLPAGSFKEAGTNVNAAIVVIEADPTPTLF